MRIARAKKQDIPSMAGIAKACFSGMKDLKKAKKWLFCNFHGFPRMQYFTAQESNSILGYVLWVEKGGFREKAVFEMEQIAVHPEHQGKGIGSLLIKESLSQIKKSLQKRGSRLKLIEITTGVENKAQQLYKKTIGARTEAVIKDFFREDEAIMIARTKNF